MVLHRTVFSAFIAACILAGCSAEQREEMEADKLQSYDLTASELEIAKAFVEGMKIETNMPMLRSKDYTRIICYTKLVRMPGHLRTSHLRYLANYAEADKDFYGYFKRFGVHDQTAYAMSEKFHAAWDKCHSMRAMMQNRDEIKAANAR